MSSARFQCRLAGAVTPLPHFWEHTVGSCHAPLALRADWRAQLRRCRAELGFRHVRFHGLLCDDVGTLVCWKDEFAYSFFNADQIGDYLLELGPSIAPALVSHLQDPSPAIRGNVATVLGALGDAATVTALQPLTGDKDRTVAQSATRAIDRIKHRAQLPRSPSSL